MCIRDRPQEAHKPAHGGFTRHTGNADGTGQRLNTPLREQEWKSLDVGDNVFSRERQSPPDSLEWFVAHEPRPIADRNIAEVRIQSRSHEDIDLRSIASDADVDLSLIHISEPT